MKLDPVDLVILRELSRDGRASFRQIARRASISTPTVSTRFERMKRAGLIQKFIPVFDLDASENPAIMALVTLRVPTSRISRVAKEISEIPEVLSVFLTTGTNNMMVKIGVRKAQSLQRFLTGAGFRELGVEVSTSQIITETIKDEQPLPLVDSLQMKLHCDLCKGEINTSKTFSIKMGPARFYFCCKTCRRAYLEKHGQRIRVLNQRMNGEEAALRT